ncbi:MAG TPA: TIGR03087 family PEP-CTERM/XrtA system glycosyltransferase [Planctomycetes bacterium]|nr:TIGR03087 family PEP-CTERM/XrtA system glycosyltransferase [Planctomycetota bacterium]
MELSGKRIVLLAHRMPWPPNRGDRITTWNLLRHFHEAGAQLRVGCFQVPGEDGPALEHLRSLGIEVFAAPIHPRLRKLTSLLGLLGREALTLRYFHDKELLEELRRWIEEFRPDLCLAYSSSMGWYFLQPGIAGAKVPMITHFAELDSDKWEQYAGHSGILGRWIYGREARSLLAFERELARAMDLNLVVSPLEKTLFETRIPGAPVEVLPNGVDLETFRPGTLEEREEATLIFTGVMNYHPNVDGVLAFVEEAWPQIQKKQENSRFIVLGSKPSAPIQRLGSRPGIEVTGFVEDTRPWFRRASIAVVPLRIARGIQNKVLEAMAMGLPVVCTKKAFEGIDARPGEELIVVNHIAEMTEPILDLMARPEERARMGKAARKAVEERYDWTKIFERLDGYLARLF